MNAKAPASSGPQGTIRGAFRGACTCRMGRLSGLATASTPAADRRGGQFGIQVRSRRSPGYEPGLGDLPRALLEQRRWQIPYDPVGRDLCALVDKVPQIRG